MYLYQKIELCARHFHAGDFEEWMKQAAFAMDYEWGSLTVAQFFDLLKKKDPNTKKRKNNDK